MKIEYRAFREIQDGLPDKVIEYAKDELRYKILSDNGLNNEMLKHIEEMLAYFKPKLEDLKKSISKRTRRWLWSMSGKLDFILMTENAYSDIIGILEYKKKSFSSSSPDIIGILEYKKKSFSSSSPDIITEQK